MAQWGDNVGRQVVDQPYHVRVVNVPPHVSDAMEAESRCKRFNALVRELVGDGLRRKADSPITLEDRTERMADLPVTVHLVIEHDARIRQRQHEFS